VQLRTSFRDAVCKDELHVFVQANGAA